MDHNLLIKTFGTNTKASEMIYLLEGIKSIVRQGFYPKELERVKEFCKKNNLHISISRYKVSLEEKHYTNKGMRVPETEEGIYLVYISKDEKSAALANYFETIQDHKSLGILLGYPKCCIDFFIKNIKEGNFDPQLPSTNPLTDTSRREEDKVILSHFPCSADCRESIRIAEERLEVLDKYPELRTVIG